ncbi:MULTISPECIES: phosphotransferase family protein [unclassified Streptomyces]|uniref:phosphotransferase family protein n=1 Tax=unclassified Streptomyces TaxID=2593676 RepID=UPI002E2A4958|nr:MULTISPECIES: aminoglycoside phosphotransferase family protein [unclassified Streptomyces]WUB86179.1 aminoglycoside phosphotransferase family protein [Streptomyces sp. NBC_00566]
MTRPPIPTPDTVRALVRSLLRSGTAEGVQVRPVVEGRPYTWWVGARHVLRLAPDREASVRLRREARVRDLVRPHLPVAVPASVAYGDWSPGLACTLDARLTGDLGGGHEVSAVGEADLAGLLTGLRAVPVRQAETLGVPRVPPRSLGALRRIAAHAAERLAAADEFDATGLRQLTPSGAAQLAAQPGTAVLTHHRLTDDHVLISTDGRVRAVLDWTGASLGDPAEDIAALATSVGAPAAVRAATLAGYGPRPCLRGLWLARCDTVIALTEHLDDPTPALRAALLRAWEPIMLERVTELKDDE